MRNESDRYQEVSVGNSPLRRKLVNPNRDGFERSSRVYTSGPNLKKADQFSKQFLQQLPYDRISVDLDI